MDKIEITMERYEELIKKEAIYDVIMINKNVNIYLVDKKMEEKNNGK